MVELAVRRLRMPAVQTRLARSLAWAGVPVSIAAGAAVGGLGFANGGYFPVSWGWAALGLLALAGAALVAGVAVELDRLDRLFLAGIGAFACWIALSLLWTGSVPRTVLENERMVVYVAAATAALLLLRRRSVSSLIVAVWFGGFVVSTYGLATRLFPDHLGSFDPTSDYRLWDPVGYWNAFGILAGMCTLLALGLAARSGPVVRSLAGASTVVFMLVLYFTFSRGSWWSFFFGLAVAFALDRRRLQLITTALVLTPWPLVAIWVASTAPALSREGSSLEAATTDGHGLAVIVIGLMVAAALAMIALDWVEAVVSVPHRAARIYGGTLVFVIAAMLIVVFGRYGFPQTLARKAYDAFNAQPTEGANLNSRLFSLSSNGRIEHWHTAWQQATSHPVLGGGAGTYDQFWSQHRREVITVHDAHSLYLETLAELGPPGLLLLTLTLTLPLVAIRRARSAPLTAIVAAAYAAYLLHAAADWDWEMPAITLTALFCGIAIVAAARRERDPRPIRRSVRFASLGGVAVLFGFALLGLLGNSAVSASSKAMHAGNYRKAVSDARRAADYEPWSPEPWRRLGEAQANLGNYAAARVSLRTATTKDPKDWTLWYELALASLGSERNQALRAASRLNPLSPEIAHLRDQATG